MTRHRETFRGCDEHTEVVIIHGPDRDKPASRWVLLQDRDEVDHIRSLTRARDHVYVTEVR